MSEKKPSTAKKSGLPPAMGDLGQLFAAAELAVERYEALPVGRPFQSVHEAAVESILELKLPAVRALLPLYVRTSADTVSTFVFYEETWPQSRYWECAADLHDRCFDVDPEMASLLRSAALEDRIAAAAAAHSAVLARDKNQYAEEVLERYRARIAGQLLGVDAFEPFASVLAKQVPALTARIDAVHQRHAAAAKATA